MTTHDLLHHGDSEATPGLVDLAVNVFPGPRPPWLEDALRQSISDVGRYPSALAAEAALAGYHARDPAECVATSGAAEAFTLLARWRAWQRPVVVHPQFTEPHAALLQAGRDVTSVVLSEPFELNPSLVPDDADLVVIGNPTNPTGVLHAASAIASLCRPGRTVVVDEAFMDAVPGEPETLAAHPDVVVIRSLTKQWSIPGVRAGYLLAPPDVAAALRAGRTPWSVSTPAIAAMLACSTDVAREESAQRALAYRAWRETLEAGLSERGVMFVPSSTAFVLTRPGSGVRARLRERGIAVRRADTFPGLDKSWVRIAVRPPHVIEQVLRAWPG